MTKKIEPSLQQQIDELERLVAWFDSDDIDLEDAIGKFSQGSELAARIRERLAEVDNKITVLREQFDKTADA